MKQLDVNKLLQISVDGPSVNQKFLEWLWKERKGDEQYQVINIGSCGLHTILGAFKTGAENTKWNIKQVLKGAYEVFDDSPARRDDFESVTGTKVYPFFFCVTRQVQLRKTIYATCTYQLLESLITYFTLQQ